jgi:hypothetical protein
VILRHVPRTLGNEHPEVAQAMQNLAMWQFEAGDVALPEPLVREALAMRRNPGTGAFDVAGKHDAAAEC